MHLLIYWHKISLKTFAKSNYSEKKVKKIVHYEYCTKFYITRCENADFRTRSVRKTAFTHSE